MQTKTYIFYEYVDLRTVEKHGVIPEIKRFKLSITALPETKKKGQGSEEINK